MTALYTEGQQVKTQDFNVITMWCKFCTNAHNVTLVHPLTLLWLETRQCSHTFTRCSKQNKLVTFLFGHLQRPIATCAVWMTNKQLQVCYEHKQKQHQFSLFLILQAALCFSMSRSWKQKNVSSLLEKACDTKRFALNQFILRLNFSWIQTSAT